MDKHQYIQITEDAKNFISEVSRLTILDMQKNMEKVFYKNPDIDIDKLSIIIPVICMSYMCTINFFAYSDSIKNAGLNISPHEVKNMFIDFMDQLFKSINENGKN